MYSGEAARQPMPGASKTMAGLGSGSELRYELAWLLSQERWRPISSATFQAAFSTASSGSKTASTSRVAGRALRQHTGGAARGASLKRRSGVGWVLPRPGWRDSKGAA